MSVVPQMSDYSQNIFNMEYYTPRQAAKFLSSLTGRNVGHRSYYDILREFGIIDRNNIFLQPYSEEWCYDSEQYIQPRQKVVAIHRKVLSTRKGVEKIAELLQEYWAKNN